MILQRWSLNAALVLALSLQRGVVAQPELVRPGRPEIACTADVKKCDDGSYVSRNPFRNCEFHECPPIVVVDCSHDAKICKNDGGFKVKRNPDDDCNFYDCELKCCDPDDPRIFFEGRRCCGVTGEWVGSFGDGKTFTCAGHTSSGPEYPPPFGQPCEKDPGCPEDARRCPDGTFIVRDPKNNCQFPRCPPTDCKTIKRKKPCTMATSSGCQWLFGTKECINQDADVDCEKIRLKPDCRKFSKCKYKRNTGKCLSKCKKPKGERRCTREYRPVKCKGGCVYPTLCVAQDAGQNANLCKRVCGDSRECVTGKEICLNENPNSKTGVCVAKDPKNICGGIAGFQCPIGKRCVSDFGSKCGADCAGACVRYGCKRPVKNNKCTNDFNPVQCGPQSCTYKNPCLAAAAGFGPKDCTGFCPRPNPRVRCGPEFLAGFQCGDNSCRYGSKCLARSAGFKPDQCKKDCSTMRCANALKCPPGQEPRQAPDECCPRCVETKPDCSAVTCPKPQCKPGQVLTTPSGECCPVCQTDCSAVSCLRPKCNSLQVLFTPPGECCPICKTNCANVLCKAPECEKALQFTPSGECCPKCMKMDCRLVRCAFPTCPDGQTPVTPEGECCPQCPDKCSGIQCDIPKCPYGQTPVTKDGDCCPSCPTLKDEVNPFSTTKDKCADVECPVYDCAMGHHPVPDPDNCCDKCVPEGCGPDCTNSPCVEQSCDDGKVFFTPLNSCCGSCVEKPTCNMRCAAPKCKDDEEEITLPTYCCPICKKKCPL